MTLHTPAGSPHWSVIPGASDGRFRTVQPEREVARAAGSLSSPFEVDLERVGSVTKIPAPDHAHQWREQSESALWAHLQLMIDASPVALRREAKTVPTLESVHMRNDPHLSVSIELLNHLDDFAKTSEIPFEPRAIADLPVVEPVGRPDCWVPACKVPAVDNRAEDDFDRRLDDLSSGDDRRGCLVDSRLDGRIVRRP